MNHRCLVPCANHFGEVHEALLSFIDERTQEVRMTARHVASGEVCEVPFFEVDFDFERSQPQPLPVAAAAPVAFDVPISAGGGAVLQPGSPTRSSLPTASADSFSRGRMAVGVSSSVSPESFPKMECEAGPVKSIGSVSSLCPWCVLERAMNGQGSAPRTGFVAVERCSRHAASSELLAPRSHTPPAAGHALSHAAAPGFPVCGSVGAEPFHPVLNPNAGVRQAFPKGRWS